MYTRVYLTCFHCKCEFFVEQMQLEANADRRCPNCGQPFDYVGLGMLAQALRGLGEAAQTVTFRFEDGHQLQQIRRAIGGLSQAGKDAR